jgi:putative nucleotidyltransferase with HDIG domain
MVTQEDTVYIRRLFPEIELIKDISLAQRVIEIWAETWHASEWVRIEDAPKNPSTLPANRTLVAHVRAVTQQTLAVAKIVKEIHDINVDTDVLLVGSLLHDVSKLLEYGPGKGPTRIRDLIQHGVYGAHKAMEKDLPIEVVHMIISHTMSSKKAPATLECVILHYVDYADSDALLWASNQPLLVAKLQK